MIQQMSSQQAQLGQLYYSFLRLGKGEVQSLVLEQSSRLLYGFHRCRWVLYNLPYTKWIHKNIILLKKHTIALQIVFMNHLLSLSQPKEVCLCYSVQSINYQDCCISYIPLSLFNKPMQKAINRMWDWLFHTSVRSYKNPSAKALIFRYPSPGSSHQNTLLDKQFDDYKTPYQYSEYDVRYTDPTPIQKAEIVYQGKFISPSLTPLIKLKKAGLLQRGQENNPDAVAEAKTKYLEKFGVPVEQSGIVVGMYYHNDLVIRNDLEEVVLKSINRQEIAALVQSNYQKVKEQNKSAGNYSNNRKTIDDPQVHPLQSLDLYVDPKSQMSRISNQYMIQQKIKSNLQAGKIKLHVGDANFWKAIDDSFPQEEVGKVQRQIGDPRPTDFSLGESQVELEVKDGKVTGVHPKS